MSRTLFVTATLSVPDDADDEAVADFVLDVLCNQEPSHWESCDGTDWKREPE